MDLTQALTSPSRLTRTRPLHRWSTRTPRRPNLGASSLSLPHLMSSRMGVTTIYQRISKLPGVCIHNFGLGLVSWRRVPYLNLTPVTFRVPDRRAPLSCTHFSRACPVTYQGTIYSPLIYGPCSSPWTHRLSYTFVLRVNHHLNIVDFYQSTRRVVSCDQQSRKLTSPVTPQSTFAYQQHTTSMIMTPLQFTISSFLTLFTFPLTRHDSMSRNDLNPSKDSYGCFSNPSFLNLRYCVVSIFAI